jgi:hypothetical protein
MPPAVQSRNVTGQVVGLLTFLGGVTLLALTFKLAYDLFQLPPATVLGLKEDQPIDVQYAGRSAMEVVIRIVLLLMMCVVGSVIANRGIRLYQASIGEIKLQSPTQAPAPVAPTADASEDLSVVEK